MSDELQNFSSVVKSWKLNTPTNIEQTQDYFTISNSEHGISIPAPIAKYDFSALGAFIYVILGPEQKFRMAGQ